MPRRLFITLGFLAVTVLVAAGLLYQGIVRFNYPSEAEFPIQGVDVSHHQGMIYWAAFKRPRVSFAYIKASEGATFKDPDFVRNWSGASKAGIVPGAYHFFTLCRPGAEQAANFLSVMAGVGGPALPPAIDLEFGGNCAARPTPAAFEAELRTFMQEVASRLGCRPILYVTHDFHRQYVSGHFGGTEIWMRNIFRRPAADTGPWLFWQFANRGRMSGVQTFIDLNVFNGDAAKFARLQCTPRRIAAR